jgi:hypothetical protein
LKIQAANIVEFLQRAYYIKIDEIVFDFIKDKDHKWWFLSCKGFKLDYSINLAREIRDKMEENKSRAEVKQLRQEL